MIIVVLLMILHIELILRKEYAPETILIRVFDSLGEPDTNSNCRADISSNQISIEDRKLKNLNSVYDFLDANTAQVADGDKGYYLLETGFEDYQDQFEVRIVCIASGNRGVSYTIINNTNKNCELKDNGRFLVC